MTYLISGNCHAHQIASSLELMTGKTSGVIREPKSYRPERPEHAEAYQRRDPCRFVKKQSHYPPQDKKRGC